MTPKYIQNQSDRKDKYIGWHVVAIFDLLGQQDALRNLTVLPNPASQEEMEEFKRKVEKFYAPLTAIRKFITSSIKTFQEGGTDIGLLSSDQQEFLKKFRNTPTYISHFSDSTIVDVPLIREFAQYPCRAIYGVLAAAAQTMIACTANKMPLRGGIDLGIAMNLEENEIYGPALVRAYTLESRVAQYPRIVVGNELVRYLQATAQHTSEIAEENANSGMARKSLELLAIDDDGQAFLDYLGVHFRDRLQHLGASKEAIQMAYSFIIEQSAKYKEEQNSKLGFRYTLIRNYFESRLSLWGLSPDIE